MTADAMVFYDAFKANMANGAMDLDTDTFKLVLVTSSYTYSAAHDEYADITNELSTANGYTSGGYTLGSVTFTQTSGTAKFDSADVTISASGGSLVFRRGVVYDDTSTGDKLMGAILFDNTPADITITTGNSLNVVWNASGIWTLT